MKNICLVCACLVRVVQRFSAWNTFVDVWWGKKYPTLLLSDDTLASSNNIHSVRWMSYGIDEVIAIIIIIWYSRGLKLSLSLCLLVGVCMQFHNWKCKKKGIYTSQNVHDQIMSVQLHLHKLNTTHCTRYVSCRM